MTDEITFLVFHTWCKEISCTIDCYSTVNV